MLSAKPFAKATRLLLLRKFSTNSYFFAPSILSISSMYTELEPLNSYMFWSSSPTASTLISSFFAMRTFTRRYSYSSISCASSMTNTVFVTLLASTSPVSILSMAIFTMPSDFSRFPICPRRSKQYEWKVLISTNDTALPISSRNLCRNSVAAAREKVSIRSCSCLTSSIRSKEASLCTRTLVFPLPGPAAATIYFESLSLTIESCAGDNSPNRRRNLAGVMFIDISSFLPLKYLLRKTG